MEKKLNIRHGKVLERNFYLLMSLLDAKSWSNSSETRAKEVENLKVGWKKPKKHVSDAELHQQRREDIQ